MTNSLLLTAVLALPLLGALLISLLPGKKPGLARWSAALSSGLTLLLTIVLALGFRIGQPGLQFASQLPWLPSLGISYHVGIDGLSLPMLFLNSLLVFLAVLASWKIADKDQRPRFYFALLLVLQAGVGLVFAAQDLLLFFVAWELELIPMYFLIGLWGGPRREYAAMKFLLYTLTGSALMLVAFVALYILNGNSADIPSLLSHHPQISGLPASGLLQALLFTGLFIGFAIKLPLFPFHTWLPDAHVEASTPISVLLAGVLLKMGAYGLIRFNWGMFPDLVHRAAPLLLALAVVNILYGAMVALVQDDMKKVIAYSSVSHMGFVILGLAAFDAAGFNGAILQMFTHGTITAMLFLGVGVVYEHTHTRQIPSLGGLASRMPVLTVLFVVAALASLGLPGLAGFAAEILVFLGAFATAPWFTAIAALGIILTAAYMLWLVQRVFFAREVPQFARVGDATVLEMVPLAVLALFVTVVGLYPPLLLGAINGFVTQFLPGLG